VITQGVIVGRTGEEGGSVTLTAEGAAPPD
jgi:hypothetical protein